VRIPSEKEIRSVCEAKCDDIRVSGVKEDRLEYVSSPYLSQ